MNKKVMDEEWLKVVDFIFQNSSISIFISKEDGSFYDVNEHAHNSLGYSKHELMSINLQELDTKFDAESWANHWLELRTIGSANLESKHKRKDGTLMDVEKNIRLIKFNNLELKCAFVTDITKRKKSEAKAHEINEFLQRQAKRLLLATESAQLGIWDWNLENNTLLWDDRMYKLYGVAKNEFNTVYEGWISRLHEEDRIQIHNEIQLAIDNKKNYNTEFRIVWSDSSIHYIRATGVIDRVDGKPIRMIGVNWDVTAEKENEQHLKLLESVILNTKDSIMVTEAEPIDESGPIIIFVNPAFEKMTGYTFEEVIGKSPRFLQNKNTDRKELDKLRTALNKWESFEITILNTRKNGENFWNNLSVTPVANEKGWFTHWIAIERDVTKEIEGRIEKERMINELLKNNLDLKQFGFITTHNLRAPLTNLISICNLLELEKIQDKSIMQLIEAFKTSTYKLNDTLNDLINILIIKEKTEILLEKLNFEETLKVVKESISESLSNCNAIIEADFSEVTSVYFTKVYLNSIFFNLITNSIKYRHKERTPIIKIKTSIDAVGRSKLTFSDNGIGIDMTSVKQKIFGFHQRFHNNIDSKGLGLFLIKSQINALGGEIEVDSGVNVGTTFTITFKDL